MPRSLHHHRCLFARQTVGTVVLERAIRFSQLEHTEESAASPPPPSEAAGVLVCWEFVASS